MQAENPKVKLFLGDRPIFTLSKIIVFFVGERSDRLFDSLYLAH
jgi:hypothetical protein